MSDTARTDVINCPKCKVPMRRLKAGGAEIDRCEECFGIWLDKGERHKLLQDKSVIAGVDIGSAEKGREQDEITEADCPRCGKPMQHLTDRAQKHIGFEFCRACHGSFFDAGELTDLSDFTLMERLRSMLGR